jgi:hypothetical protein
MLVKAVSLCRHSVRIVPHTSYNAFRLLPHTVLQTSVPIIIGHQKHRTAAFITDSVRRNILITVGTGQYSPLLLTFEQISKMNRIELFKALRQDDVFCTAVKDLSVVDCKVWVLPGVAGNVPTGGEEAAAAELRGCNIISHLLMPGGNTSDAHAGSSMTVGLRIDVPTRMSESVICVRSAITTLSCMLLHIDNTSGRIN